MIQDPGILGSFEKKPFSGWLVLNKPNGLSSAQALRPLKRLFHKQKIGHAGTLDPLARGLLPVALGEATKMMPYTALSPKEYTFDVVFGEQRDTDDEEGNIECTSAKRPSYEDLESLLPAFRGSIAQVPPVYSAVKSQGKRAYFLARSGEKPDLKAKTITIQEIQCMTFSAERATLRVLCGSGSYMRALARDIGIKLGCYAYAANIERRRVGFFDFSSIISWEALAKTPQKDLLKKYLISPESVLLDDIPALTFTREGALSLMQGRYVPWCQTSYAVTKGYVGCFGPKDHFFGIGYGDDFCIKPKRLFQTH